MSHQYHEELQNPRVNVQKEQVFADTQTIEKYTPSPERIAALEDDLQTKEENKREDNNNSK